MLSWVEHENSFITSGPDYVNRIHSAHMSKGMFSDITAQMLMGLLGPCFPPKEHANNVIIIVLVRCV